jgi:hypothetical protein
VRAAISAAASGAVIGFSAVFLLQQVGFLSLSEFATGLAYFLAAAIAGAVVFGIGGWLLSRSAIHRAKAILAKEGAAPAGEGTEADPKAPKSN